MADYRQINPYRPLSTTSFVNDSYDMYITGAKRPVEPAEEFKETLQPTCTALILYLNDGNKSSESPVCT
eukprot:4126464-Pyramimonas_sp.AAC.1